jgi:hypothetical protein
MTTAAQREYVKRLQRFVDLSALCTYLGYNTQGETPCVHDFRNVRTFLNLTSPDMDPEPIIALIERAGFACDCEVWLNLCPSMQR